MATWVTHRVDTLGARGAFCRIFNLAGKPAILYYLRDTDGTGKLYFARSTVAVPDAADDWVITLVEELPDDGGTGYFPDPAILSSNPAAAYRQKRSGYLRYASSGIAAPAVDGDWSQHSIEETQTLPSWLDLAVINSNPAVVYFDEPTLALKYACAAAPVPNDTGDWTKHTISTGTPAALKGRYCRLLDGSVPRILSIGSGRVWFHLGALALPNGPEDWAVHDATDTDIACVGDLQALLVATKPAFCVRDAIGTSIIYGRSGVVSPDELADWSNHVVYDNVDSGALMSLGLNGTTPAIAFDDQTVGSERVRFATTGEDEPTETADWSVEVVANAKAGALSYVEISGNFFIAYYDLETRDLVVAKGA